MNIAIIPARRDSKRLPGKNMKVMNGKPLIAWTIEQALECKDLIDMIVVTTNDLKIITYVNQNYPKVRTILRPEELCLDNSLPYEYIQHVIDVCGLSEGDTLILLQCTSPLRKVKDIKRGLRLSKVDLPVRAYYVNSGWELFVSGIIYVFTVEWFREYRMEFGECSHISYITTKKRSLDIDTYAEFKEAEERMKEDGRV